MRKLFMNQYRKNILDKTADTGNLIYILAWLNVLNLFSPSANGFATFFSIILCGLISFCFFTKEKELLKQWKSHGR
jgi:hypothetical protein